MTLISINSPNWLALPQPNVVSNGILFIFVSSVIQVCVSLKIIQSLLSMTSINNSSAAKFLALFCIPALILASGSFDVATSVIV